jgi:hypothetical protein
MIDARHFRVEEDAMPKKSLIEIQKGDAYYEIIRALNRRNEFGPKMIDCGVLGICYLWFNVYWHRAWHIPESLKSLIKENKKKGLEA